MSSSSPHTYILTHSSLLASWSSYKDSTLSALPSNVEQDLEVFRQLVIQSQTADALPVNREAASKLAEAFKQNRKKESADLVARIDEMAKQTLSALEKAEAEMISLRSHPVQPSRSSYNSYPNRRTLQRQPNGTWASMLEEEEKEYQERRAKQRAAAKERWEMGEFRNQEETDRGREGRDRRRDERRRGEEKKKAYEGHEREVEKVAAGVKTDEKSEQERKNQKEKLN